VKNGLGFEGYSQARQIHADLLGDINWLDYQIRNISLKQRRLGAITPQNELHGNEISVLRCDMDNCLADIWAFKLKLQQELNELEQIE